VHSLVCVSSRTLPGEWTTNKMHDSEFRLTLDRFPLDDDGSPADTWGLLIDGEDSTSVMGPHFMPPKATIRIKWAKTRPLKDAAAEVGATEMQAFLSNGPGAVYGPQSMRPLATVVPAWSQGMRLSSSGSMKLVPRNLPEMQQQQQPSIISQAFATAEGPWKAVENTSQPTDDAGLDGSLHLAPDWCVPVSSHVFKAVEPLVQDIWAPEGSIEPIPLPDAFFGRGCQSWDLDVEATYQQALLDGCQSPPEIFSEIPSELLTPCGPGQHSEAWTPSPDSPQRDTPATPRGKAREDRRQEAYTKAYISFGATPSLCSGQRIELAPATREFSNDTGSEEQLIVVPAPVSAQKIWESMDVSNRTVALQLPLHLVKPREFSGPLYTEPKGFHEDTVSDTLDDVTSSKDSSMITQAARA